MSSSNAQSSPANTFPLPLLNPPAITQTASLLAPHCLLFGTVPPFREGIQQGQQRHHERSGDVSILKRVRDELANQNVPDNAKANFDYDTHPLPLPLQYIPGKLTVLISTFSSASLIESSSEMASLSSSALEPL